MYVLFMSVVYRKDKEKPAPPQIKKQKNQRPVHTSPMFIQPR